MYLLRHNAQKVNRLFSRCKAVYSSCSICLAFLFYNSNICPCSAGCWGDSDAHGAPGEYREIQNTWDQTRTQIFLMFTFTTNIPQSEARIFEDTMGNSWMCCFSIFWGSQPEVIKMLPITFTNCLSLQLCLADHCRGAGAWGLEGGVTAFDNRSKSLIIIAYIQKLLLLLFIKNVSVQTAELQK